MSYIQTVSDVMDRIPAILSQKALKKITKTYGVKFVQTGDPEHPKYRVVRNTQNEKGRAQ